MTAHEKHFGHKYTPRGQYTGPWTQCDVCGYLEHVPEELKENDAKSR